METRLHRYTHDSGVRSLVCPLPSTRRAVVHIFLRTGSRYEAPHLNGISHFLEHMLFRGTAAHPSAHALARTFEDLGGTLVASTAADHGTLSIAVPSENLFRAIDEMAEVIIAPRIEELELERGIIREEVLENLSEDGEELDGPSLVRALAFPKHGLGQLITGPLSNVEAFNLEELRAHHALTYVGAEMVVSVSGAVTPEPVVAAIDRAFSRLPRGSALSTTPPPPTAGPHFQFVKHRGTSQSSINVAFRGLSDHDPLEPALDLLLRVIDDGMSTRLYHRLCDTRGLCYDAYASYEAYEDSGIVEIGTETAHERGPVVLEDILRLCAELVEAPPSDYEIERAKKRAAWQTSAMFDSAVDVGEFLAMGELTGTARTPEERLAQLERVTREELSAVARRVFAPDSRIVALVGNPKKDALRALEKIALESAP